MDCQFPVPQAWVWNILCWEWKIVKIDKKKIKTSMPPQACSWSRNSHVSLCGPCEGLPASKRQALGGAILSKVASLTFEQNQSSPQPLWQGDNGTFFRAHHLMFSFSWPQCPGPGAIKWSKTKIKHQKKDDYGLQRAFSFGPRACTILLYMALSGMCGQLCTKCEPTINLPASKCLCKIDEVPTASKCWD